MRTTAPSALRCMIVGLMVLGAQAGPAAGAATLRWKFKPGETLHWVMDQSTLTSVNGGGAMIKSTTTQTIDMDWVVKDVAADGVASVTQTVTRVHTKIESPLGVLEYDSKDPKEPQGPVAAGLVPLLKSLVGAEFSFKMSAQGELSDVQVPESVVKAVREAGALAGAGGLFTAEGMKNMITESGLNVPREDLPKGRSWTAQTKLPLPQIGTLQLAKTFTYQGPETRDGKAMERIDLAIKAEVQRAPESTINVELKSQEGKGSFFFDNSSGRVVDSAVSEKLEMLFKLPNAEITQSNETSTKMKLVGGDEAGASKK